MVLMIIKNLFYILTCLFFTSCACNSPLKVTPVQRGDKSLNCKQLILEIIEAENYRTMAEETQGVSASEVLTPSCWITGYISSQNAIKLANSRINYLGNIYDLNNCEIKGDQSQRLRPKRVQTITTEIPSSALGQGLKPISRPTPSGYIPGAGFSNPPINIPRPQFDQNYDNSRKDGYKALNENARLRNTPHQHKDVNGKEYEHSHPHKGFHLHAEDQ